MTRLGTAVATLTATALVAGGCLAGVTWPRPRTPLDDLVPDGRWALGTGPRRLILETQRMPLNAAGLGGPATVGAVLPREGGELVRTALHGEGVSLQLVQGQESAGLVAYGFVSDDQAFAFAEPRLDLPATLVDGATWSGATTVSPSRGSTRQMSFRYEGRLQADGECWVVERTDWMGDGRPKHWRERRCPGLGLTSWGFGDAQLAAAPAVDAVRVAVDTGPAPARVPAAGTTPRALQPMGGRGSPRLAPRPDGWAAAGESGEVVLLGTDGTSTSVLPGEDVTALGTAGEVVLVATAARRLAGYGPDGSWLYQLPLGDAVLAAPVGVQPGLAVAATVSGELLGFDPRSGEELWRHQVGAAVDTDLVALDDAVVATTVDGDVVVIAADGTERWTRQEGEGRVDGLARVGGDVVVATDGQVVRHAGDDGSERWTRYGGAKELAVAGGLVLTREGQELSAWRADDGTRAWRRADACPQLLSDGDRALCVSGGQPFLVERDGRLTALPAAPERCELALGPAGLLGTTASGTRYLWGAR